MSLNLLKIKEKPAFKNGLKVIQRGIKLSGDDQGMVRGGVGDFDFFAVYQ